MTIVPTSQKEPQPELPKNPPKGQSKRELNKVTAAPDSAAPTVQEASKNSPKPLRATVLSAKETTSDTSADVSLRPQSLAEYIGQSRLKAMLTMSIAAAKSRSEALDHVLFYGPPGLGKTTLAKVLANEMGARIHMTSGPTLERPRDIIGLVHQLAPGDVLFIDEIHRLNRVAEELLYPAIEDFVIDLTSGKGQATRTMRLPLPKFTLIGATTKAGMIANALRDRFGFVCRLEFYTLDELKLIVARTAKLLNLNAEPKAIDVIAARARGTPRIANRLVRLVRDYTHFVGKDKLEEADALKAMEMYQVDAYGLDATDRRLLEIIVSQYDGGPVGLETIAATLGEDSDTLEEVYEPFLIQAGFIQRTSRGRVATHLAYTHLGKQAKPGQLSLDLLNASAEQSPSFERQGNV